MHVIPYARRKLTTCWNPARPLGGPLGPGPTGRRLGRAADPEHMSFHATNLAPMQLLSYPRCLIRVNSINRHGMALFTRCHMSALFRYYYVQRQKFFVNSATRLHCHQLTSRRPREGPKCWPTLQGPVNRTPFQRRSFDYMSLSELIFDHLWSLLIIFDDDE